MSAQLVTTESVGKVFPEFAYSCLRGRFGIIDQVPVHQEFKSFIRKRNPVFASSPATCRKWRKQSLESFLFSDEQLQHTLHWLRDLSVLRGVQDISRTSCLNINHSSSFLISTLSYSLLINILLCFSDSCRMQYRSFCPLRPSMDFICSSDFDCFFFFSQIPKLDTPQTSFHTLLPFYFHSRQNTFYTRFFGFSFFPSNLVPLPLLLRRVPNLCF